MNKDHRIKSEISCVELDQEKFYKISDNNVLRPFFMSIVSDSNHWMFISSNGGLSAGRKNSDHSLFPYYTDDKITESYETTGSKSIFQVSLNQEKYLWEPFSIRQNGVYKISRNLYKNEYGNKLVFEEINHDLKLIFSYKWSSSNVFGFVKTSTLKSISNNDIKISILDGIQNIVPAGVGSDLQNQSSNLVDAYKRSELISDSGLAIYALSAIIVDKAEPSEALKANIVWSNGIDKPKHLLSSLQLDAFRENGTIEEELDIKAEKGSFFIQKELVIKANSKKSWSIIADVNKNHSAVFSLIDTIKQKNILEKLNADVNIGTYRLKKLLAASDGIQLSADQYRDTRHLSNTLFNIMRGGIFDNNYTIEKKDFKLYLSKANKSVAKEHTQLLENLNPEFSVFELKSIIDKADDVHFKRLSLEYLPLKFSRRHGDPSRPWNKFSINTRSEVDGSKILDYEGNWRDIFQNWEALAYSYPTFAESMIHKFLNATTFEGYNPYRVTKDGFDWETIELDNPWSYIGYWGDHQIIYLLKLLEILEKHKPGKLSEYFDQDIFVYANVPYKIKSFEDTLRNPKDTIEFDHGLDTQIRLRKSKIGADGALVTDQNNNISTVNFIEKILATVLSKMSNFIPEGGIWMNTQRPEWNDANNALVGNGVSMVTLYYLRRFFKFFEKIISSAKIERIRVSVELVDFYERISEVLESNKSLISGKVTDKDRKYILDGIAQAGSDYRDHIYKQSFGGQKRTILTEGIIDFINKCLFYIDHSIRANKRADKLYHAYNLMSLSNPVEISIDRLSEMLEGQVAVLSSGYLSAMESLELLDSLKKSRLFRPDQYSYILYPNKKLPKFLEKNFVSKNAIESSTALTKMIKDGFHLIVEEDVNGNFHFNGDFKNANDLKIGLKNIGEKQYIELLSEKEIKQILEIYEEVFNHKEFTGRSGTFYGYEGLGSIYWHMVSKLQLAVQECCLKAIDEKENDQTIGRLLEHYYEINEGIGIHKPPSLYGAFPTDPYSHTPGGKGAQQPGMTGQVKEDILSRFGELGVFVRDGHLVFHPCLLRKDEFLISSEVFSFIDIHSNKKEMVLDTKTLAFTYCQVPIVYHLSNKNKLSLILADNTSQISESLVLDKKNSQSLFERTGLIREIHVYINENILK